VDFVLGFLSSAMTIAILACIVAGVLKIFQISSDLRELKDVLHEIKRNTQVMSPVQPVQPEPPQPAGPLSPEALVRAVHAQSYESLEAEVFPPQP
jgi:hypothetical protein